MPEHINDAGGRLAPKNSLLHKQRNLHQNYDLEDKEWAKEVGKSCAPLLPEGEGVIKTLPPPDESVFSQELPSIQNEVIAMNNTYLEVTSGLKANKWMTIIPGFLGFPAFLIMSIYLCWFMFARLGKNDYSALGIIIIPVLIAGLAMAYSLFSIAAFSPEDEPIRFSRNDSKIYRYQAPRWRWLGMEVYRLNGQANVEVFDWEHCRAEVVRKVIATGATVRRDCFLELAILDPTSEKVIKRFRVGDRDMYGNFFYRIVLWETIRRYMEIGVAAIPAPVLLERRATMADCVEEFNPFSLPAKATPGAQKIFSYLLAMLLWIISLPTIFAVISRWISFKISGKVNWGELEQTVFMVSATDPSLPKKPWSEMECASMSVEEVKRRRQAAVLWFISIIVQLSALWWFFFTPSYYR